VGSGLFSMRAYQRRFGECDLGGTCVISTTRQSAITGLLSAGAVIGAVGSGGIAARVSRNTQCTGKEGSSVDSLVCEGLVSALSSFTS
jgi:SP family sugar:H+ symporter-like MFS transporter